MRVLPHHTEMPVSAAVTGVSAAAGLATIHYLATPGRILFGLAMMAFGVQNFIYGDGVFGLEPVPRWFLSPRTWSAVSGLILLGSGYGLVTGVKRRPAAVAVAVVLSVWTIALQAPRLIAAPYSGNAWTAALETLALCGAAWVLAATTTQEGRLPGGGTLAAVPTAAQLGHLAYAGTLPLFGVLHFVYRDYVASVIPGWIPAPMSWVFITGLAFVAAGLGMLTGRQGRLAAAMVGGMFLSWVLLLHAPRVAAAADSRDEWTSLVIALAMSGGAWIIAGLPGQPSLLGSWLTRSGSRPAADAR